MRASTAVVNTERARETGMDAAPNVTERERRSENAKIQRLTVRSCRGWAWRSGGRRRTDMHWQGLADWNPELAELAAQLADENDEAEKARAEYEAEVCGFSPCPRCGGKGFVNPDGSAVNAFEGSDADPTIECPTCR